MKLSEIGLDLHQLRCIFRQIYCPVLSCKEKNLMFKDISVHLTNTHSKECPNYVSEVVEGTRFLASKFICKTIEEGTCWSIKTINTDSGATFYVEARIRSGMFYSWLYYVGSSDEAKNFSCKYSVSNKTGEEFIYTGPVHTLDMGEFEVLASGSVFGMPCSAVGRSLNENETLEMFMVIKKVKGRN